MPLRAIGSLLARKAAVPAARSPLWRAVRRRRAAQSGARAGLTDRRAASIARLVRRRTLAYVRRTICGGVADRWTVRARFGPTVRVFVARLIVDTAGRGNQRALAAVVARVPVAAACAAGRQTRRVVETGLVIARALAGMRGAIAIDVACLPVEAANVGRRAGAGVPAHRAGHAAGAGTIRRGLTARAVSAARAGWARSRERA